MDSITIIPVSTTQGAVEGKLWNMSVEAESEYATLAAICHLKQQQREPLAPATGTHQEDWLDDEELDDSEDNLSVRLTTLTSDHTKTIKMELLDRLAEILCCHKHASHVTCTSMIEYHESVTIVAARNADWTDADIRIMGEVVKTMEQIASREPPDACLIPELCEKLADHYISRLKHHVQLLHKRLEKEEKASDLVHTCMRFLSGRLPPIDIVKYFNRVFADNDLTSQLRNRYNANISKRILYEIECIRRPQLTCDAIFDAARNIPTFQQLKVQLLKGFDRKVVKQSTSCFSILPNGSELQASLRGYRAKPAWVHAEMRMTTYLLKHDTAHQVFPYLGISKKTCLLCGHMIQQLGRFLTRGNHGKVYPQWRLPSPVVLLDEHLRKWQIAVEHLQAVLQSEAKREDITFMQLKKESTISTPVAPRRQKSNLLTSYIPDPRLQVRESEWLSSFSRRELESRAMDNVDHPQSSIDSDGREELVSDSCTTRSPLKPERRMCSKCEAQLGASVSCPSCKSGQYCGIECRKAHWWEHKFACRLGRSIDAADFLVWFCKKHEYPDDEDVTTKFGFRHFTSAFDRDRLFKIYCELVNLGGVTDDELREALKKDKLKKFIIFRGSQLPLPPQVIGGELNWIKSHESFAANSVTHFGQIMNSARDVLSSKERDNSFDELDSGVKQRAYIFYCQTRNGYMPDADEDNWLDLGFCTARGPDNVQRIAHLYGTLIKRCKFDEFWRAMNESTIVELFKKYGLGLEIEEYSNFEPLMKSVGKWHQSVWELKRFVMMSDREPHRAVNVDYGFMNCRSAQERADLRSVYSKFFSKGLDEMELHQACVGGRLASFLVAKLGELPFPAEVLLNAYPLERCGHMGLVAQNPVICRESDYHLACEMQKTEGVYSVVWTIPDDCDHHMIYIARERAAHLTGRMQVSSTSFRGQKMDIISNE